MEASIVDLMAREILAKHYWMFPEKREKIINGPWSLEEDAAIRAISEAIRMLPPENTE